MKYFGTDGIRGVIDETLDAKLAYKVGLSIGASIIHNNYEKKVFIGNDTRLSNDLIKYSLSCGLIDMGVDCYMLGIVPTACVSYLVSKLNVGYGVMITASHNTWDMNGIKVFNRYGYKCNDLEEEEIENRIIKLDTKKEKIKGKILDAKYLVNIYISHLTKTLDINLSGLNITLDTANGSNYLIAPNIFRKLGANVVAIANKDDGKNINNNCGAQYIDNLKGEVLSHGFDYGFAFDGDADRLRVILSDGTILDGDDIIYIFATYLKDTNNLNRDAVVGTIMTNSGLEKSLKEKDIQLFRVDVGDKNVIELMRKENYQLGGESSGHIALSQYNPTCDALFNALYFLKIVTQSGYNLINTLNYLKKTPSLTISISVSPKFRKKYLDDPNFVEEIEKEADKYRENARIVVRPSGTEAVFRITIESESKEQNLSIEDSLVEFINLLDRNL